MAMRMAAADQPRRREIRLASQLHDALRQLIRVALLLVRMRKEFVAQRRAGYRR